MGLGKLLLKPINPGVVVILGVYTIVWGLWVINPYWDVFTTAAIFSKMKTFAPEVFFGAFAIFYGLITSYGAIKPSYQSLTLRAIAAWWHWLMVSIFYFWGDWQNTGGITAATFMFYAAFVFVNIRVNYMKNGFLHPPSGTIDTH